MADDEAHDDQLDPALIARLEAWFGAPTTAIEAPPPPAPRRQVNDSEDHDRARRRRSALEAAARGPLMGAVEARGSGRATMIEPLPPIILTAERPPNRFDLSRWRLLTIEPGEADPPEDIWDALAERTPQALLRDLHRPVFYFDEVELEVIEVLPRGAARPSEEIRALLSQDYRWRPETSMRALAEQDVRALRSRLRHEPWSDAPAEIARIRAAQAPQEPERELTSEELVALFEPPR
ncbi:MAG TPA: hypothetical protein VML75_10340 [Kofleriaceae bacterium]|nr:hypothetical protein [Kofleriaceae bacterium]